jgi:uncharacterized protein YpmB
MKKYLKPQKIIMNIVKDDLKLLKKESHEKVAKYQYELEVAKKKIIDLKMNQDKLIEENKKLRDQQSMNYYIEEL